MRTAHYVQTGRNITTLSAGHLVPVEVNSPQDKVLISLCQEWDIHSIQAREGSFIGQSGYWQNPTFFLISKKVEKEVVVYETPKRIDRIKSGYSLKVDGQLLILSTNQFENVAAPDEDDSLREQKRDRFLSTSGFEQYYVNSDKSIQLGIKKQASKAKAIHLITGSYESGYTYGDVPIPFKYI